jgi:hypothetical protein
MQNGEVEKYLSDCVRIEPMALEEEYVRLPGDLAYWNAEYASAYRRWLEAKIACDAGEGQAAFEWRNQLELDSKGRVTAAEVESRVRVDTEVLRLRRAEAEAEADKVRLYGVLDAIRSKRDMLISLGAHIRQEMENDPMVRQRAGVAAEVARARRDSGA